MYSNLRDVEVGFSQDQIDTIASEILKSGIHWQKTDIDRSWAISLDA